MRKYISISLAILILVFFGLLSMLLIANHQKTTVVYSNQQIIDLKQPQPAQINQVGSEKASPIQEQVPASKIMLSYERTSTKKRGIIVKTRNLDEAANVLEAKGAEVNKFVIGDVLTANIPENQIDSLKNENSIEEILPNREVKAFSINTNETNAESFWNENYRGNGIRIAVLDTGIDSEKVVSEKDFTGEGIQDYNGHGTKVAEIILAMAPDAQLIDAKVLNKNGAGSEASVIAGINYAVEQNADIISLSLGGYFNDINSPLVAAVEDAVKKGVIVVVAAGNCGMPEYCNGYKGIATPGNSPNAITVGSVSGESAVPYSPGQDFGSYIKPDVVAPENANSLSGTSASTPFVSGAAALVKQKYNANPLEIKSLLEKNAKDLGIQGKDAVFGSGKLNLNFIDENVTENEIEFNNTPESTNEEVHAFEGSVVTLNGHPDWYVMDAWPLASLGANAKLDLDVYNDSLMIVTGSGTKDYSSVLIWNGNSWLTNNKTGLCETMYKAKILNSKFAVIGGWGCGSYISSYAYTWNGTSLKKSILFNTTSITENSRILDVYAKSETEAYALESNGRIYRYSGTWSLAKDLIYNYFDDKISNSDNTAYILNENNMLLTRQANSRNEIWFYNGANWINTSINTPINSRIEKVILLSSTLGYAISGKKILKFNGASWSLDYTAPHYLYDITFAGTNLGFAAAGNNTMTEWNGASWTSSTYTGRNRCTGVFDFKKVNLISANEGYATGYCSYGTGSPVNGDGNAAFGVNLDSNWIWNGVAWKNSQVNFTSPLPSGLQTITDSTLRFGMWKAARNGKYTFALAYDDSNYFNNRFPIGIDSNNGRALGGNMAILRLKRPLSFYVPPQSIPVDGTFSLNLSDYSSLKPVSFSIISEDANKVECTISKDILTATGKNGFKGIGLCEIKASAADSSDVSNTMIYVGLEPTQFDLSISKSNVQFDVSGNPTLRIHSVNGIGSVSLNITLIKITNNAISNRQIFRYTINTNQNANSVSPSFSIKPGESLEIVLDSGNELNEADKANNIAIAKIGKNVYLNLTTESSFVQTVKDYLSNTLTNYNIITDATHADNIINIGYNLGDKARGCALGNVYDNGVLANEPHTGLIFTVQNNGVLTTNVCGARIEGLVNALKRLNKDDVVKNKDTFFDRSDLGAISIRDYFNGRTIDANTVATALNGPLEATFDFVQTNDGTLLRIKEYKPVVSQSFLDYLTGYDSSKPWLNPVVMAGGLWSDITAWDDAGKEIASGIDDGYLTQSVKYAPRDVWLIELTGGPGTDCETCPDYTYDDLTDNYWPALIGGIVKKTGMPVDYVGHSNGGRTALDAMSKWQSSGKTNAGKLSDGSSFDLPPNAVDTFIGVGVPGKLDNSNLLFTLIRKKLGQINKQLSIQKINHTSINDIVVRGILGLSGGFGGKKRISLNLWNYYGTIINSTTDIQPGAVKLNKVLMIGGWLLDRWNDDEVVPLVDIDEIYDNINVTSGTGKKVLVHTIVSHTDMISSNGVKTIVKQFLNDDPLSGNIINQVNG